MVLFEEKVFIRIIVGYCRRESQFRDGGECQDIAAEIAFGDFIKWVLPFNCDEEINTVNG